jgi:hypothetical protein
LLKAFNCGCHSTGSIRAPVCYGYFRDQYELINSTDFTFSVLKIADNGLSAAGKLAVFEIHPDFFASAIESGGIKPVTLQQIPPVRFVTSQRQFREDDKGRVSEYSLR